MSNTVYALIGYETHYPRGDNTIRVFDDERAAERWRVLLECAARDSHFPVTYAELKQDFEWVPDRTHSVYEVIEHEVYTDGWADE